MAKKASSKKGTPAAGAAVATGVDHLGAAVNATNTGTPYMATQPDMASLVSDARGPLVEFNANMKDGDKIAYRATALGVQVWNASQAPQTQNPAPAGWGAPNAGAAPQTAPLVAPVTAPAAAAQPGGKVFNFAAGVPLPSPRRGGRGSTVYGFEQMNVGQSFFIPKSNDNPNPAKRIASTVSSASARLEPKKFIVRSVVADAAMAQAWGVAVGSAGAGVWRTE